MSEISMEKVDRAIDTSDGGLDAGAVADLNKTETVAAICEVLDVHYTQGELEATDRVTHSTLRGVLSGAVECQSDDDEGYGP